MLYLSPPLEHARAAWVHQFHAYLHTVAGLPRLRSKSFAVLGGGEGSTDYQRVVKALPREILKKAYEEIESRLAEVSSCTEGGVGAVNETGGPGSRSIIMYIPLQQGCTQSF